MKIKNKLMVIAISAVIAIIGFVGCSGDGGGSGDIIDEMPTLTGTVTIDNMSPKVGETLTASYSGGNGTGTPSWQWLRGSSAISGANSQTYQVVAADQGYNLRVRVSYAGFNGYRESNGTEHVAPAGGGTDPITYTVTQRGGVSGTTSTNEIVFTFSQSISSLGLTADDISVSGAVSKHSDTYINMNSNNIFEYVLRAFVINSEGDVTVSITKTGIEAAEKTVAIYRGIPNIYFSLSQIGGHSSETTTGLKIYFYDSYHHGRLNNIYDSYGFTANDITLSGAASKGSATLIFDDSDNSWLLSPITVTETGDVSVEINSAGYNITNNPQTIYVYYYPRADVDIGIGDPTVKLFLDGVPLTEGGNTEVDTDEHGTYVISIDSGTYSEIVWRINGEIVSQGTSNTSIMLPKRNDGIFYITVEVTSAGKKNTGSHVVEIKEE